ncbi:MAG: hypothetical protein WC091_11605 [Sulfuricellaceae bacterium]
MLHTHLSYGEKNAFPPLIAADAPVGMAPDLQPIIHDFEHNRAKNKQRQPKKRPEPPPELPKTPDSEQHVDEYA